MLHGLLALPTFAFWDFGNIWTGSLFTEFNYRIVKRKTDDKTELYTVIWYGMKCFDLTDPSEYVSELCEEFSPEGLERTVAYLNEKAAEFKTNRA